MLRPAAEALGATGPLPADTVFVRAMRGEFDAVLAPYHDVGMTAIKVAAFGRAVNVTLGLPFPRTSPDHGTAFDIAGHGDRRMPRACGRRSSWRWSWLSGGSSCHPERSEGSCASGKIPRFARDDSLPPYRLQPLHQPQIRLQLELLARPVRHQHRPAFEDRLPLHQPVRAERVPRVHQIDDPVREPEQRRHLDRAVHLDDVHRPAGGREVGLREPRVLGGDASA